MRRSLESWWRQPTFRRIYADQLSLWPLVWVTVWQPPTEPVTRYLSQWAVLPLSPLTDPRDYSHLEDKWCDWGPGESGDHSLVNSNWSNTVLLFFGSYKSIFWHRLVYLYLYCTNKTELKNFISAVLMTVDLRKQIYKWLNHLTDWFLLSFGNTNVFIF